MRVCPTPVAGPPRRWPLASPIIVGPSRNCCRFMCHRRAGHLPNNVGVPHMRSSALLSGGAGTTVSCGATGEVLVTNYRDFVLLGRDTTGKRVELETYRLAESEMAFWAATSDPYGMAEAQGERCTEFLRRVMLYAAPLTEPADVAWFLASYAR